MLEEDGECLTSAFHEQAVADAQLDWRWRYCLSRIDRLEASSDPVVFFDGPDSAALLSDTIVVDCLHPYLRFRLGYENAHALGKEVIAAMNQVMDAASEWVITPHSWSLRLESGVLARQPVGEVMPPEDGGMSRLAQVAYERVFFDIRERLDNPRECAALLCANPDRLAKRGLWDLKGKVAAYILGHDEFERWRCGKPSSRARTLCREVEQGQLYLDGLSLLGLDRQDDFAAVLARQFESAVAKRDNAVMEDKGKRYTPEQVKELLSTVNDKDERDEFR